MTAIRPFPCYYANPGVAPEVACPAYDGMTPGDRHRFACAHPRNYLNVMRSTEEFPEQERPGFDENLQRNSERLQQLIREGVFTFNATPGIYVYRLALEGHTQTGLIAEIPVEEFDNGTIRKHENTRRDKEDILIRYRDTVRASSTPITLTYPASPTVDDVVARVQAQQPLIDFTSDDGVRQTIWFVDDPAAIATLQDAFARYDALYLADGHHRSAVVQKWAAQRRAQNPEHTGEEPYNFVLTAIFPHNQLRILEYNRLVADLNGMTEAEFLDKLSADFEVEPLSGVEGEAARPRQRHEFSLFLPSGWYRLNTREGVVEENDPVCCLDACVLQKRVLAPLLGISDPRGDPRLDYVPGAFGIAELERRVREGWGLAFACYPTSVREMMAIADAGEVMPPKSTWVDPKVRSGLILRLR